MDLVYLHCFQVAILFGTPTHCWALSCSDYVVDIDQFSAFDFVSLFKRLSAKALCSPVWKTFVV